MYYVLHSKILSQFLGELAVDHKQPPEDDFKDQLQLR